MSPGHDQWSSDQTVCLLRLNSTSAIKSEANFNYIAIKSEANFNHIHTSIVFSERRKLFHCQGNLIIIIYPNNATHIYSYLKHSQ